MAGKRAMQIGREKIVNTPLVEHRPTYAITQPRRRRGRRARGTHVVKTLWPPQAGTIKLSRRYGPALLCVRYRHDEAGLRRYTTVELIVDEAPVKGNRLRDGASTRDHDDAQDRTPGWTPHVP